jgi:hypothetical protein
MSVVLITVAGLRHVPTEADEVPGFCRSVIAAPAVPLMTERS